MQCTYTFACFDFQFIPMLLVEDAVTLEIDCSIRIQSYIAQNCPILFEGNFQQRLECSNLI